MVESVRIQTKSSIPVDYLGKLSDQPICANDLQSHVPNLKTQAKILALVNSEDRNAY